MDGSAGWAGANLDEGFIALAVFLAAQTIAFAIYLRRESKRRSDLIVGLAIEIRFNMIELEQFLEALPSEKLFVAELKRLNLRRPHWNYAHHSLFYEANVSHLVLNPALMEQVMMLYNSFASLKADIGSLQFQSYTEITDNGREWFLSSIWQDMRSATEHCRKTLYRIEQDYTVVVQQAIKLQGVAARSSQASSGSMTNVTQK